MDNTLKIFNEAQSLSLDERKKLIKLLVDSLKITSSPIRKKEWNGLGSAHLGKVLDQTNLRDFAYE